VPPFDEFSNVEDVISQGRNAYVVTPSGSAVPFVPKALWIANAGDITGIAVDDISGVTFRNVPVGIFDAVRFRVISAAPADTIAVY
jgi:hypothetical protein